LKYFLTFPHPKQLGAVNTLIILSPGYILPFFVGFVKRKIKKH